MKRKNETQATINLWQRKTFGPPRKAGKYVARANKEMAELLAAVADGAPKRAIADEAADTVILLMGVCNCLGINLQDAINRKMKINRARTWRVDGDGIGQHVEN